MLKTLCTVLATLWFCQAALPDTYGTGHRYGARTYEQEVEHMRGLSPAERVHYVLGPCNNPCRVTHNYGGMIYVFDAAANALLFGAKTRLEIDGHFYSAGAILADKVAYYRPERVCITPRASFRFHKTSAESDPPHSHGVHAWVMQNGGYPSNKSKEFLVMPYPEAKRFWRTCPQPPLRTTKAR